MEDRKNFVSLWDIIARPMKIIRQLFMIIFAAVIGLMTASCDLGDVEQGLINSTISSTVTENGKDEDVVKAIEKSGFAERLETLE